MPAGFSRRSITHHGTVSLLQTLSCPFSFSWLGFPLRLLTRFGFHNFVFYSLELVSGRLESFVRILTTKRFIEELANSVFHAQKLMNKLVATKKAILRALKLLVVGLFVQGKLWMNFKFLPAYSISLIVSYQTLVLFAGGFLHGINDLSYGVDISKIRWMGVLQVCKTPKLIELTINNLCHMLCNSSSASFLARKRKVKISEYYLQNQNWLSKNAVFHSLSKTGCLMKHGPY